MGVSIYDNYNRPKVNQEPGGGEKITESAGYIPIKVQVETMLIAGQRLGEYRAEKYDYAGGEEVPDDVVPDPTRSGSFDLADGTQMGMTVKERLVEQQKRAAIAAREAQKVLPEEGNKPEAE